MPKIRWGQMPKYSFFFLKPPLRRMLGFGICPGNCKMKHNYFQKNYLFRFWKMFEMSLPDSWLSTLTFLVEGVMLVVVASVGLVGNILSFTVLSTQGLQKTFHNLLLLLNIFDMVCSFNSLTFYLCFQSSWFDGFQLVREAIHFSSSSSISTIRID